MVWINDISELEFYSPSYDLPCYGDALFTPNDLILQGQVPTASGYNIRVYVYSPDGLTLYGEINSFFDYYVGLNTDGVRYFNIKLREWPSILCSNGCFILNVIVEDLASKQIFNKYTQKYVIGECTVTAGSISITDDDGNNAQNDCAATMPRFDDCGNKYNQIYTTFNCVDQFTGDYYGLPVTIYLTSGTPFKFYRSSWIQAEAFYNPVDTKRNISLNCRVQKTERTRSWIVLGTGAGAFSLWKAQEIEDQLTAENIYFNGKFYVFAGGQAFSRIIKEECRLPNHLKLNMTLSDCYEFQIESCSTDCQ